MGLRVAELRDLRGSGLIWFTVALIQGFGVWDFRVGGSGRLQAWISGIGLRALVEGSVQICKP